MLRRGADPKYGLPDPKVERSAVEMMRRCFHTTAIDLGRGPQRRADQGRCLRAGHSYSANRLVGAGSGTARTCWAMRWRLAQDDMGPISFRSPPPWQATENMRTRGLKPWTG